MPIYIIRHKLTNLKALKGIKKTPIRNTVLLDLYTDSHDGSAMEAYRYYKMIKNEIKHIFY